MKIFLQAFGLIGIVLLYQNCSPFSSNSGVVGLPSTTAFSLNCLPGDPRNPSTSELKRLNKFELENTLVDLFEPYMNTSQRSQFLAHMRPFIDDLPNNREETGMDLANQGVTLVHVERHFLVAEAAADFVANNSAIMNQIHGNCSSNPNTDNCRQSFLQNFGLRVLRRPLDSEDISHYMGTMNGHTDSYRNVLAEMMASPSFYYHGEFGAEAPDESGDEILTLLDPYEKANKLSYFLLQSMPDAELLASAQSGALNNPGELASQVDRLLTTPKVRRRLTRYFANQWLHLDDTSQLRLDIQEVQTRLSELGDSSVSDSLRSNMIEEVYDYFDYLLWEQQASYAELMTSELVFPRSRGLATIYGTNEWNGDYDLASLVRAPASERSGVLTRAQFLFTGTGNTRPIIRGFHVYRDFMCQNLRLPDDNSTPEGVEITDDMTDREVVLATTEVPGTSCVGCHQSILNPLGFAFDNFDSFGRFRTQERVFHPEGSNEEGQVSLRKDVVANTSMQISPFVEGEVENAIDLSRRLAQSPDAQACFSSKIWNFAQKQNLAVEENACAVQSVFQSVGRDGSIIDAIKSIALQPEFMKRKIQ